MNSTSPQRRATMLHRTTTVLHHSREVVGALGTVAGSLLGGPRSRGGVAILIDHTGRMLMVQARYRRTWTLPGGFLQTGEDPEVGIRRELSEEVAFPAEAATPPLVLHLDRRHHEEYVAVQQLERAVAIKLHIVTWELRTLRWCRPSEMPPLHAVAKWVLGDEHGLVAVDGERWKVSHA
jgi:ADP-ribose pyrophosphatase YjhB (NUDIX family)